MAESIKDKAVNAGNAVVDTAKHAGNAVADAAKKTGNAIVEGAVHAKDWVAEKTGMKKEGCGPTGCNVQERMDVIASCGKKVGVVDHVEGETIKLTRNDSPDGQHHFIPAAWVDHVDTHVHLKKNSVETESGWKSDAASCSTCGA